MKALILGAGASKAYSDSFTDVRMPIATDFFSTFKKLKISENPWVLIGDFLNYLRDYKGVIIKTFYSYDSNIEQIHSEIEHRLSKALTESDNFFDKTENIVFLKAYMQLIFLFVNVINEIQNGPVSKSHINLAQRLNSNDTIITFNWDTLMDRALKCVSKWNTNNGYYVKPKEIYRDKWIKNNSDTPNDFPLLLKLHGSTNWLTSHTRPENRKLKLTQELSPDSFFVYESNIKPYNTYDGRYMDGYQDFSYGYYPPNLPLIGEKLPDGRLLVETILRNPFTPKGKYSSHGLVSMPLIIPPIKNKDYSLFGDLFKNIWEKAEEVLSKAKHIIIIGYSFPKMDYQSNILFKKAFLRRTTMPNITIVNPNPDRIVERFMLDYGITKEKIVVIKEYFIEEFNFDRIIK